MGVGNNLNISSLQETSSSKNSAWGIGGGIGFDLSGFLPESIFDPLLTSFGNSLDANVSYGQGYSDGRWVGNQTAIIGKGGVDIFVSQNTDLTGAVIAADNGQLMLNTGTLSYSDLNDHQTGQSWKAGIGLSFGEKGDRGVSNLPGDVILSGNYASHSREQVDRATIGDGTIIIRKDPEQNISGLNRDKEHAQEVTKEEETSFDLYISSKAIVELLAEYKEVAEKGFVPNLLPGAGINESNTGQDYFETDAHERYKHDQYDNRIIAKDVTPILSDQNPFLKFLYHVIPGIKSFSEVHDKQMKAIDKKYNDIGKETPTWVASGTILPSFLQTFVHAIGSTLDISNWGNNWGSIKQSYEPRDQPKTEK